MKENLPANYPDSYFSRMLRTLLEDYFANIKQERDFDFPLMSLLAAMGWYDIHLTHGDREIGKDFIAKKIEEGVEYQYAIQSKKGDINQKKCAEEVIPQLTLAAIVGLPHPQFDKSLPRRVILVSTGKLIGNAGYILQDFNDSLEKIHHQEKVEFWGTNQLIPLFEQYGLSSIHQLTAQGLQGFAQFYLTYSKALDGKLTDKEIETFSQLWIDPNLDYRKRILRASIEAEIIAVKLVGNGLLYDALITYLALARTVMSCMYEVEDDFLTEVYQQILDENIIPLCREFRTAVTEKWEASDKQLLAVVGSEAATLPMLHYIVWCARALEISSLNFFLAQEQTERDGICGFLREFIEKEPGCGHIPSDRYATTLVWTTLALIKCEKRQEAIHLIKRAVIWLCDRLDKGFGLASYDADEYQQTATLVGYPFDAVKVHKNTSSFLATVLADLAAFTNDQEFYSLVVNDFAAVELAYEYWQFPDTSALFTILSDESRTYPNTVHEPTLSTFEDYQYAQHIVEEPSKFRITDKTGLSSLLLLSVLLKDRYFPKIWNEFLS